MRYLLAVLATATLGLCLGACEAASKRAGSSSGAATTPAAPPGGYVRLDGDKDGDDEAHPANRENDDQSLFAVYGEGASPADTRAIGNIVRAYYAAALAGDATKACSLLHADFAAQLSVQQSQPGQAAGGCVAAMTALLAQEHGQLLADEVPTMLVTSVHVKGELGLAVLGFRRRPQGQIALQREGRVWKLDALLDSELT